MTDLTYGDTEEIATAAHRDHVSMEVMDHLEQGLSGGPSDRRVRYDGYHGGPGPLRERIRVVHAPPTKLWTIAVASSATGRE